MDDPDDRNRPLVDLEIHRVGKSSEQNATKASVHDQESLGIALDLSKYSIDLSKEVARRVCGSYAIPLECLGNLVARDLPNDYRTHSDESVP
ncbi:MAG: hypothetical protein RLZZ621_273 [Gemmatimonadota bacterium]